MLVTGMLWAGPAEVRASVVPGAEVWSLGAAVGTEAPAPKAALEPYLARWQKVAGEPLAASSHRVGLIPVRLSTGTVSLAVNLLRPRGTPRGTLYFVHGYLSHSANFAYLLNRFLQKDWQVVTLDLPGHGLSGGPRGDIGRFSDYGDAVAAWWAWGGRQGWTGPRLLMAHSLGTASCLEALRRPGAFRPDRAVFLAPLVKTVWFPLVVAGNFTAGWWLKSIPGDYGWDGYLDGQALPAHWLQALVAWVGSLDRQRPLTGLDLRIYAGTADHTVDSAANRQVYRRLVPQAAWVSLEGQDHLFMADRRHRGPFADRLLADLGL